MKSIILVISFILSVSAFAEYKLECELFTTKKNKRRTLSTVNMVLPYKLNQITDSDADVEHKSAYEYFFTVTVSSGRIKSATVVHVPSKQHQRNWKSEYGNGPDIFVTVRKKHAHLKCHVSEDNSAAISKLSQ